MSDVEQTIMETNTVMKTLPMKYKCMHYAIIAFISSQSGLSEEQKKELLEKIPIHNTPQEQNDYYTNLVDFKNIDTTILKPMKLAKKNEGKIKNKPIKKKTNKNKDTVKAYRDYYINEKSSFLTWTKRKTPKWINND